jgi:hypothetical protein
MVVGRFTGRCCGVVGDVGDLAMGVCCSAGSCSDSPGPDSVRLNPPNGSSMRS